MTAVKKGPVHIIRLEPGERIIDTLAAFCLRRKIGAASFQGLGTCRWAELGFFRTARKRYALRKFRGDHEIVSLQGNVSLMGGKSFVHAHIVLSGPDFLARGGHLKEAEVAATCEIVLRPIPGKIQRKFDPDSGLNLLDIGPSRPRR